MDYFKTLEARSIFILREAYKGIAPLPMPVIHVDTGKKLAEMYAFRERYAGERGLDIRLVDCPGIETIDPGMRPAARSAARKSAIP